VATTERKRTDYWCLRCKRVLRNELGLKPQFRDTVTGVEKNGIVGFRHDQCKRGVVPGK
jgi:hypothetical protein